MSKAILSEYEVYLLNLLVDMVRQHLVDDDGVYETGWIGVHKDIMQELVKEGIMEEVKNGVGRGYWAKFKPEWEGMSWKGKLELRDKAV